MMKKKYQKGGKLQSENLGSNLKGGTFYTAGSGRVGRLTSNTGLKKDAGLNSSIDTTGYSKGKKSFDYMESTSGGTQKTPVTREKVLPIIENLKKGALKTEKFKEGGKMPLKKASGKGKAAVQKAVSANIQELTRANREKPAGKKRSKEQIAAIAYSAARKK
jgi:hypothetical protein